MLAIKPRNIFWSWCLEVQETFQNWCQIICEIRTEPTHVNKLVPGKADYKATLDTPGEVSGGVLIPCTIVLAPIVWSIKCPDKVKHRLVTFANPTGNMTNSDLEMAAEVLGWLILEGVVPTRFIHAGVCSDKYATVSWKTRGASRRSRVANQLLRILTIQISKIRGSLLVTCHLAGDRNMLGDIPYGLYRYKAA